MFCLKNMREYQRTPIAGNEISITLYFIYQFIGHKEAFQYYVSQYPYFSSPHPPHLIQGMKYLLHCTSYIISLLQGLSRMYVLAFWSILYQALGLYSLRHFKRHQAGGPTRVRTFWTRIWGNKRQKSQLFIKEYNSFAVSYTRASLHHTPVLHCSTQSQTSDPF